MSSNPRQRSPSSSLNNLFGGIYPNVQPYGDQTHLSPTPAGHQLNGEAIKRLEKERLYHIQQQRLQMMTINASKLNAPTTDKLIENILKNSDIKPKTQVTKVDSMTGENAIGNFVGSNASATGHGQFHFSVGHSPVVQKAMPSQMWQYSLASASSPQTVKSQTMSGLTDANTSKAFLNLTSAFEDLNLRSTPSSTLHNSSGSEPKWLVGAIESNLSLPAIYGDVWKRVKLNDAICETSRLYPILLSSQLHKDVLAVIWTQANMTIPGQLTPKELCQALALIALTQQNPKIHWQVNHLLTLESAPIPKLDLLPVASNPVDRIADSEIINLPAANISIDTKATLVEKVKPLYEGNLNGDDDFADFESAFTNLSQRIPVADKPRENSIKSENIAADDTSIKFEANFDELVDDVDDFDDFKSADFSVSTVNSSPTSSITFSQNPSVLDRFTEKTSEDTPNFQTSNSDEIKSLDPQVDRYQAFKELQENDKKEELIDEFGDFKSHSCDKETNNGFNIGNFAEFSGSVVSDEIILVWTRVLECCKQVLHKTFNILVVNHGNSSVSEALKTDEGNNFAKDLAQVFEISQRVSRHYKKTGRYIEVVAQLIEDIEVTWKTMNRLFREAQIDTPIVPTSENQDSIAQCGICYSNVDPVALIRFAGHDYHSDCANLWLNCICPTLPVSSSKFTSK